jgi:hypothetical protein
MVSDWRGSETVIQRVLAQRALRAIDRGEHVVAIQINPRPIVERAVAGCSRHTRSVRFRDRVEEKPFLQPRQGSSRGSL